jgi:GNAT superfamily N-acetyltransferase
MEMFYARNILFDLGEVIVSEIGLDYLDEVQSLLERCADYDSAITGKFVEPEDSVELLTVVPAGKEIRDKHVLGIFYQHEGLIGVLDAVQDYPNPRDWFIGLLLLDPHERNRRIGEQTLRAFERWAREGGAQAIQLSVLEENQSAYRFWSRCGYQPVEKRVPAVAGLNEHSIYIFRRKLETLEEMCVPG